MLYKKLLQIPLWLFAALLFAQIQADEPYFDNSCAPSICCDDTCCNRFWFDADYLYWKIENSPESVPLVIEGSSSYSPILGEPDTRVVLGGKRAHTNWRSGARFELGYWFDNDLCCGDEFGIAANYFILPNKKRHHQVCSDGLFGSQTLAVPFFDVTTDTESSIDIAYPGSYSGLASRKIRNSMQGAELNGLMKLPGCGLNLIALGGFRWWNFDEHFDFFTSSPYLNFPDTYKTIDKFHTQNNFYGGQLGVIASYCTCGFYMNAKAKVALGAMCEEVAIDGHLITNDYTPNFEKIETFKGGYFALPTNSGHHKKTKFAVIPEVDINLGYQVMDCLRLQVGYTFIYVSDVLWAGKQLDRRINPTQSTSYSGNTSPVLEGEASPRSKHKNDSLWVQGVNVGLELTF